jgi:PAS domain S-box-containing protein
MAKGDPFEVEERELNNTGEHRPPLARGAPFRDKNGAATKRNGAGEAIYPDDKQLFDIIEAIPVMAWTTLPDGSNVFSNKRWADYTGLSARDTAGSGWQAAVHPEDVEQYLLKWRSSLATGEPFEDEARFRGAADGEYRWFLGRAVPLRDGQGNILRWYGILTDIEDRKRAEALLAGEKRILEMVAKGCSLSRIVDSLCRLVEEHTRDALTSVLLIEDGRMKHVGKPKLPRAYVEAVDGTAIGPTVGSCGTAAYFARQVIVSDIASDPLWADYRDLALAHSLRAAWSTPIMSSEGKVIGTFAMYYREPRSPSPRDQEIVEQITHLAGVAIQRTRLYGDLAEREAKIRRLVEANIIGILFWEGEGQILEANDAFLRLVGYDRNDLIAGRLHRNKLMPPEWRDRTAHAWAAVKSGTIQQYEKEYFRKDGSRVPVLIGAATFEASGNEGVAFVLDLSERKRAEDALRESEERFRTLVQFSFDVYWESDAQHRFIRQEFAESVTDAPAPGSEIGKTRWEVPYLEPDEEAWRKHRETMDAHMPFRDFELARPTPDGGKRYVSVSGLPVFDKTGRFIGYRGVGRHITERKWAEEELRASEARFRTFVDHATDAFMLHRDDGTILDVNRQTCESLGYSRNELIGMTPIVFDPDANAAFVQNIKERVDSGEIVTFESRNRRKDGTVFPVEVRVREFWQDGQRLGISLARDITERKRAEEALRESEEQWRAVFENNPTMYLMVDVTGNIVSVNPFGAKQLGYRGDELIGRRLQELFYEADREAAQRNTAICLEHPGRAMSWELRKIRKDGEVLWVRETARAMSFNKRPVVLIACEDITEGKRAAETLREVQMELAHANRVATMGQLTASIAHEVKQPIAATVTNAQAALRFLDPRTVDLEEVRQILNDIVKDGNRAGEVISRIRGLTKKEPQRRDRLEINGAICEVIELTRGEAVKNSVSVRAELADSLPLVQGDKVQLQQVILNLIVNAIEAMSDMGKEARELLISSGTIESGGVLVTVRDSGPGLAPATLDRLFDAFYTTKPSGLGMGLSICRSIVEAHGGNLWASANDPQGAVFQFTVPAVEGI